MLHCFFFFFYQEIIDKFISCSSQAEKSQLEAIDTLKKSVKKLQQADLNCADLDSIGSNLPTVSNVAKAKKDTQKSANSNCKAKTKKAKTPRKAKKSSKLYKIDEVNNSLEANQPTLTSASSKPVNTITEFVW